MTTFTVECRCGKREATTVEGDAGAALLARLGLSIPRDGAVIAGVCEGCRRKQRIQEGA